MADKQVTVRRERIGQKIERSGVTTSCPVKVALARDRTQSGAPRPMKMGTTASPWRYEVAAADAIRPDNRRRTAILRYASWAAVFPISWVVRLLSGSGHFFD